METIIMGLYRDYRVYIGVYIGIMEKKMETTLMGLYRDYRVYIGVDIGIMENTMETTIMENQMEKKIENEMETGGI